MSSGVLFNGTVFYRETRLLGIVSIIFRPIAAFLLEFARMVYLECQHMMLALCLCFPGLTKTSYHIISIYEKLLVIQFHTNPYVQKIV